MKKIMCLLVFLAVASMAMAAIEPVKSVVVTDVPGTPYAQKLLQSIPITRLRVPSEIPLGSEVLQQKPANPGAQQVGVRHDVPPSKRNARIAGWPDEEARASCSGTPGCCAVKYGPDRPIAGAGAAARRHPADTRR